MYVYEYTDTLQSCLVAGVHNESALLSLTHSRYGLLLVLVAMKLTDY